MATQARDYALSKGIIIADTKFEFGVDASGTLFVADEVLTPGPLGTALSELRDDGRRP